MFTKYMIANETTKPKVYIFNDIRASGRQEAFIKIKKNEEIAIEVETTSLIF